MSTPLKLSGLLAGTVVIGSGIALWARFGSTIYFDLASAGFIGCIF